MFASFIGWITGAPVPVEKFVEKISKPGLEIVREESLTAVEPEWLGFYGQMPGIGCVGRGRGQATASGKKVVVVVDPTAKKIRMAIHPELKTLTHRDVAEIGNLMKEVEKSLQ